MDVELPGADEVEEEPGRPDAEAVYRWTIRGLYAVAIGLNLFILWDAVKDSPDFEIRRREWAGRLGRMLRPLREKRAFERSLRRMFHHAEWALVEERIETDDD